MGGRKGARDTPIRTKDLPRRVFPRARIQLSSETRLFPKAPDRTLEGVVKPNMGTRFVRITAEATTVDYTARFAHLVPEEKRNPRTLQSSIDEFGESLEGEIEDPFGTMQRISLAAFKDLPPTTYIKLQFITPQAGKAFPPILNDAIMLKEYALPEI